jgi:hypothetical protein
VDLGELSCHGWKCDLGGRVPWRCWGSGARLLDWKRELVTSRDLWEIRGGSITAAMDGSVIWEIEFPGARMRDLGDRIPWCGGYLGRTFPGAVGGAGRGCHGLEA